MYSKETGFTLIEVLVVVAIIGLMSAMGMASYFEFADNNRIKGAAQEVQVFLRDIQNRAKMGDRGEGFCATNGANSVLGKKFEGWQVSFSAGGTKIEAWPLCDGSTKGTVKTYNLPIPTEFANDPTSEIVFPPLYTNLQGGSPVTVQVTDKDSVAIYEFTISAGGSMSKIEKK